MDIRRLRPFGGLYPRLRNIGDSKVRLHYSLECVDQNVSVQKIPEGTAYRRTLAEVSGIVFVDLVPVDRVASGEAVRRRRALGPPRGSPPRPPWHARRRAPPPFSAEQDPVEHPPHELGLSDPVIPRHSLQRPFVLLAYVQLLPHHAYTTYIVAR